MKSENTCRLCLNSPSLRKSHIVSSSIFSLIRDETMNNRFYEICNKTNKIVQDGPKEYLLCDECEQKIGRYEKYYKEAIHLSRHKIKIIQDKKVAIIGNLDYSKIKLFLLSILWRMSISSLSHFTNVSLANDEEIIRKLILEENPGRSREYPIAAIIPLIEGKMNESWTCFPFVSDQADGTIYSMIIGGILYSISMTQHNQYFDKWLLYEYGYWAMPMIDFYKIPFLKNFVDSNFSKNNF